MDLVNHTKYSAKRLSKVTTPLLMYDTKRSNMQRSIVLSYKIINNIVVPIKTIIEPITLLMLLHVNPSLLPLTLADGEAAAERKEASPPAHSEV